MPEWKIIMNPVADAGKCRKKWPRIEALLREAGIEYEMVQTQHRGHGEVLAREAIEKGYRKLIAVGGDGTANEVANAIQKQTAVPCLDLTLAQIPGGTGCDWGRTIGIPGKIPEAVQAIKNGKTFIQDVGIVSYQDEGKNIRRYFVNTGGLGFESFAGLTANKRKEQGKGGTAGYMMALLSCLLKYKCTKVSFQVEGEEKGAGEAFSITIGNGRFNGGGMMQAPKAIPDDGELDLTMIYKLPRIAVIRNLGRLYKGTFIKNKNVHLFRGKTISIQSEPLSLVNVDGELLSYSNAEFTIEPKRLKVIVAEK